jgi:hypothetical protein
MLTIYVMLLSLTSLLSNTLILNVITRVVLLHIDTRERKLTEQIS